MQSPTDADSNTVACNVRAQSPLPREASMSQPAAEHLPSAGTNAIASAPVSFIEGALDMGSVAVTSIVDRVP
jgi:hypothetical protein